MQACIFKSNGSNLSVSLSLILVRNEKVKHYIRIKTHKLIVKVLG